MRAARTVAKDTRTDSAGRAGRRENTHARGQAKCTRARQLARGGEREPDQKEEKREKKKMPHQYVKKALEYSKNKLALELIRNENSSMLGLQRKVIIGRVTAKDKNGYYTVDSNFKRWGEGDGEERHDSLWTVCRRPPLHTPLPRQLRSFPPPPKKT